MKRPDWLHRLVTRSRFYLLVSDYEIDSRRFHFDQPYASEAQARAVAETIKSEDYTAQMYRVDAPDEIHYVDAFTRHAKRLPDGTTALIGSWSKREAADKERMEAVRFMYEAEWKTGDHR